MSAGESYRERLRASLNSPEFRGARARRYERTVESGMVIERDVRVPTRFGFDIWIDLFRPVEAQGDLPVLVAWTPYGKHDPAPLATLFPASGVQPGWMSDYTIFEAPDPVYWTARGYAVITADVPGTWYAETDAGFFTPREAEAHYDLIEWAGTQGWSNGKVGLSGVSYLSSCQWRVAALRPPHLAAINIWEGWSDTYSEIVRHGGIPETYFWPYIQTRWGVSDRRVEDLWALTVEHPHFDAYWRSKVADFGAIDVPAYIVASWTDHGVHTRGTLEGFKGLSSPRKWLEIHGSKKWGYYYEPPSQARQAAFFDHVLKGEETELAEWPPVRLHVRDRYAVATMKSARAWPVENTRYERLYLDADTARLSRDTPARVAQCDYDPLDFDGAAMFDFPIAQDVDLVGHMKLRLYVSTDAGDDLDLFVAVEKLRADGRKEGFAHWAVFEDGPVALGWLRVSRRALDTARSTEHQPVLANDRDEKVAPGEIVAVDIEILPSGTRFLAGETMRLIVKGRDIYNHPKPMLYMRHEDTVNAGRHRIHTGGDTPSYLLIPVVELSDAA
ncbi:putative hydrolase [Sphingobium sp. SYK-6]|uniref:CocE/NonD family hydrolase n=1 Tax=Sphingobium sp. (strain NBRC 103272 / SYK-6) TaxID=627192 RepID=UPI0002277A94|nr:CocE/NonD family hydrolase [Sphingobium sp. SYK-6]BAK68159.1 putative hydrolase [Sphingobium sp. SYK-6]